MIYFIIVGQLGPFDVKTLVGNLFTHGKILMCIWWFKIFRISLCEYSSKSQSLSNFWKVDVDGLDCGWL